VLSLKLSYLLILVTVAS